ncbi:MAG: hypothetical protein GY822_13120 [Deltaproteobacteria bacterium]|nr:hypothetical protein [Deltaproteobacteria bacterium]
MNAFNLIRPTRLLLLMWLVSVNLLLVAGCGTSTGDVDEPDATPASEPSVEPSAQPEPNVEPDPDPSIGPPPGPPTPEPIPSDVETPFPDGIELHAWNSFEGVGPVADDGLLPWIWGFQGGTMIRPELHFSEESNVAGLDPARPLFVYFAHHAIGEDPFYVDEEFVRRGYELEGLEIGENGGWKTYPFLHQLSWGELLDTHHMRVEISLEQDGEILHHFYRDLTTFEDPANQGPTG